MLLLQGEGELKVHLCVKKKSVIHLCFFNSKTSLKWLSQKIEQKRGKTLISGS